jgi:ADP-dependent phosphofructokinase/glucokinase
MSVLWQDLGPKHVKHVEFGHFSDLQHFKLFNQYAVLNADSLGMNEVEMQTLIQLWDNKLLDINNI